MDKSDKSIIKERKRRLLKKVEDKIKEAPSKPVTKDGRIFCNRPATSGHGHHGNAPQNQDPYKVHVHYQGDKKKHGDDKDDLY